MEMTSRHCQIIETGRHHINACWEFYSDYFGFGKEHSLTVELNCQWNKGSDLGLKGRKG